MRSHAIILTNTSLEERIELKEFLKSKNESVFEESCAFYKKNFESSIYFYYKKSSKEWEVGDRSFNTVTIKDFIKKFSTPSQKRNLAFYKKSGKPWSVEELQNICKYCGDYDTSVSTTSEKYSRKWVYDDGSSTAFMWMWESQRFPSNCTCLSYESVFNNSLLGICVGDEYTNSVGKLCVIKELISDSKIKYLHEDGKHYTMSSTAIKRHWTKIKSTSEKDLTMKHICEVLESKISLQSAINFAQYVVLNNAASKICSNVERRIIDAITWEKTPQGDAYWREIHRKLSTTNNASIDEETFKKYAAMATTTSSEPIQTSTNKETFMSKLKSTAVTTLDQNKEAAIIASKMETGRILNKQVLKQAAKHVPFWAKGYLDSPLAPIIAANAVAMLGNHTGNTKIQKISELMLLGAADATVQSFNLDKIIDDVLKGVKLPAGILDADDN